MMNLKTLSSEKNRPECYKMDATERILTQFKKYDIVKTDYFNEKEEYNKREFNIKIERKKNITV